MVEIKKGETIMHTYDLWYENLFALSRKGQFLKTFQWTGKKEKKDPETEEIL